MKYIISFEPTIIKNKVKDFKDIKVRFGEEIHIEDYELYLRDVILHKPDSIGLLKLLLYRIKEDRRTYNGFVEILKEYNGAYEFSEKVMEDMCWEILTNFDGILREAIDYIIEVVTNETGVIVNVSVLSDNVDNLKFVLENY